MKWTPYNPTQPQSWPMEAGHYLVTEDTGDYPVTTEAYWWEKHGWFSADPGEDEEAYQLVYITAWKPLDEPWRGE